MMMLAITLIVDIIHPNFFSGTNMINLFKNLSIRYIIALGISDVYKRQAKAHQRIHAQQLCQPHGYKVLADDQHDDHAQKHDNRSSLLYTSRCV